MPKRSSDMSENERKLRKIRKLERKIEKYKGALTLTATDPEALSILDQNSVDNLEVSDAENEVPSDKNHEEAREHGSEDRRKDQEDEQIEEESEIELEEDLPQDILAALGEGGQDEDASYGTELKSEIVKIINNILTDGMNKEMHDNLSKTKIPRNAKLLDAPKLNTEFTGLLNNSLTNRDNMLKDRQQDLSRSNNIDTFSASVPIIISYLTNCFDKGLSYQSLNCYRSALSLVIGSHIGTDERIKRLFKGFYKLRPVKPKYDDTWNPDMVLTYLEKLYPLESLQLDLITKKLAMLLILATGQRVQTLFHIKINNIKILTDGITIKITSLLKTSGPRRPPPTLNIPYLNNKPEICPGKTLIKYLETTQQFRQENSSLTNLFLTFKSPIKVASTQTISRWLKQIMNDSGIDISRFSAHSTRHASSSRALREGLTVDSIMKAVGWSSRSHTFARHYNRPLTNNVSDQLQFARAVLGD